MEKKTLVVEFRMASPIILTDALHLDAVLLANHPDVLPGMDWATKIPVVIQDGIPRCSRMLWDGLPSTQEVHVVQSIWTPGERNRYAVIADEPYKKSHIKAYKTRLSMHIARSVPSVYCVVETTDVAALQSAVQQIPGLGKWTRKGYGAIQSVSCREAPELDPWVLPTGEPARALPLDMWESISPNGPHTLKMSVCTPPYHQQERAVLCAVDIFSGG